MPQNLITTLLIPITVYIGGRLLEYTLKYVYTKWKGQISFKQEIVNDTGYLTIKPKTEVFFDETLIHLPEKAIDVLTEIKTRINISENYRIQLEIHDRIQIECIIQKGADKRINITALIGNNNITISQDIETTYETPEDFMNDTEITIDTPDKKYRRKLYYK